MAGKSWRCRRYFWLEGLHWNPKWSSVESDQVNTACCIWSLDPNASSNRSVFLFHGRGYHLVNIQKLVGGLEHFFPYIGNKVNNWLIFFGGVQADRPEKLWKITMLVNQPSIIIFNSKLLVYQRLFLSQVATFHLRSTGWCQVIQLDLASFSCGDVPSCLVVGGSILLYTTCLISLGN